MTIQRHLVLLVCVVVLPFLLIGGFLGAMLVAHERQTFESAAHDRARAIATAVDAELRGTLATLHALAAVRTLGSDNLRAFHSDAQLALASQPHWLTVTLLSPQGQQLLNARRAFEDSPAVSASDIESVRRVISSGKPVVGDATAGPRAPDVFAVPVRVPIMRDGAVRYVLTAVLKPEAFQSLLQAQDVPRGWAIGIVDKNRNFIARIPAREPGTPVAPGLRAALERSSEGTLEAPTLEGVHTFQWYVTAPVSGWTVAVAIPSDVVLGSAREAAWIAAIAVLAAMAIALLAAYFMARRIDRPLVALAAAAKAIASGRRVPVAVAKIDEVGVVAAALEEAGRAVREREEDLRAANRSKDEFLATLSHELRNPLAPIAMSPELLRRAGAANETIEETANMLERQARHMTRLVDELLDVSAITLGKVQIARRPVELGEAASRLVDTWRATGKLRNFKVRVRTEPVWIDADPVRLEQIISNLLDNSLKFTPPGGVIEVRVDRRGEKALLSVSDTGKGMSPGQAERMFGVFVQGEQSIDRPLSGLGIGLALARRLAELQGGAVEGSSAGEGRGATFTVSFPAIQAPSRPAGLARSELRP